MFWITSVHHWVIVEQTKLSSVMFSCWVHYLWGGEGGNYSITLDTSTLSILLKLFCITNSTYTVTLYNLCGIFSLPFVNRTSPTEHRTSPTGHVVPPPRSKSASPPKRDRSNYPPDWVQSWLQEEQTSPTGNLSVAAALAKFDQSADRPTPVMREEEEEIQVYNQENQL